MSSSRAFLTSTPPRGEYMTQNWCCNSLAVVTGSWMDTWPRQGQSGSSLRFDIWMLYKRVCARHLIPQPISPQLVFKSTCRKVLMHADSFPLLVFHIFLCPRLSSSHWELVQGSPECRFNVPRDNPQPMRDGIQIFYLTAGPQWGSAPDDHSGHSVLIKTPFLVFSFLSLCHALMCTSWDHLTNKLSTPESLSLGLLLGKPKSRERFFSLDHKPSECGPELLQWPAPLNEHVESSPEPSLQPGGACLRQTSSL